MEFNDGFAVGYAIGNKYHINKDGSGGGEEDEDWQSPEDWIPVPEPNQYEIYFLIEITDITDIKNSRFSFDLRDRERGWNNIGDLTIDWGDGFVGKSTFDQIHEDVEMYHWCDTTHTYTATGQFLVRVYCTYTSSFFKGTNASYDYTTAKILIVKFGSGMSLYSKLSGESQRGLSYERKMQYCSFSGIFPNTNDNYGFGFAWCENLIKIVIKDAEQITEIPHQTFYNCMSLKEIPKLPNCVTVKDGAFDTCYNLRNIDLPKCTSIETHAFEYCYNLRRVKLPRVTSMGGEVFYHCYTLKEVSFPELAGDTDLGGVFYECTNLEKVYIPKCTMINTGAFYNCGSLKELIVSNNCTFIGSGFVGTPLLYPKPYYKYLIE